MLIMRLIKYYFTLSWGRMEGKISEIRYFATEELAREDALLDT